MEDPTTRRRLIKSLDHWGFEPHKLPDEEVLCCTLILFETLFCVQGMSDDIEIPLSEFSALGDTADSEMIGL